MAEIIRHKIGSTRTIETSILVVAYLESFCCGSKEIHRGQIRYNFNSPTPDNGFWSADIIVDEHNEKGIYNEKFDKEVSNLVSICRAFVAGRGEIWL